MNRRGAVPLLLAACLFAAPLSGGARAQSLGFTQGDGSGPIEIEADNGIEWQRANNLYVARGNAKAVQGGVTVEGDELIAYYRPGEGGGNDIYRIDAVGSVRISSDQEAATGDKAVYDVNNGILVITGREMRLDTAQDTIIARDSLEYYQNRNMAVARGDALAIRGDRRLRADVLTAHFAEQGSGRPDAGARMERIEAYGNVYVSTPTDVVLADRGTYNLSSGIARVTGDVRVTRGETQLNGDVAEVNFNTGNSRLLSSDGSGRVKGLFQPQTSGGNDSGNRNQGTSNGQ